MQHRQLFFNVLTQLVPLLVPLAPAFAGGMALTMQNGSHLAHAYSAGASAEDASTVYFNPAGMALLDLPQMVAGGTFVILDGSFTNTNSLTAGQLPTAGGNEDDLGLDRLIPSLFFALPLPTGWAFGVGLSAPFGLATSYHEQWVGRYHALRSELETININPSLAWRAAERVFVGIGFNWQKAEASLSNAIDFGLLGFVNGIPGMLPGALDGTVRVEGDDTATGFNVGALFDIADGARLGLHFRSKMSHTLEGSAAFEGVPAAFAPLFMNQSVSARVTLPEIVSLSYYQELHPRFAVMADWSWWNWSRFDALIIDFASPLTPDSVQAHAWNDAAIYSVGARWRSSERLTWRAGFAYNETPVSTAELRSARIPDSDRIWLGLGAAWQVSDTAQLDFGYAHLFMKDASIANDDGLGHILAGDYSVRANILSAQLTWVY